MQEKQYVGRKAPRAFRREQLIEAVISTVAQRGLPQTTLNDVAKAAGVSHGLVNFHFQSKEALLAETLSYMSNEHREIWTAALKAADPSPAHRLNALILAEFDKINLSRDRLVAWSIFWSDGLIGSLYMDHCGENDRAHTIAFEDACQTLAASGGYEIDHCLAARVLRLAILGVKVELLYSAESYEAEEALKTAYFTAANLFPRHFDMHGLITR